MVKGPKLSKSVMGSGKFQLPKKPPYMTVFAGPNGAGKSSLRNFVKEEQELGTEIDTDAIARVHGLSDIGAGRVTLELVHNCIENRLPFSLETTLAGNLIISQMLNAKEQGFYIRLSSFAPGLSQ